MPGKSRDMVSLESLSLLVSDMHRLLRCSSCHKVPPRHLWYIQVCFHSFCKACLDENESVSLCPTCKIHYSSERDHVIHHTYGDSISGYHELKGLLKPPQASSKEEENVIILHQEEKAPEKEDLRNEEIPLRTNNSPKPHVTKTPKAPRIKRPNKNTPQNEDLLNRSLTINTTPSRSRANINKRNVKGETPLHVACCKGDFEKVSHLLEMGADPNNQDNAGWTPLHECAQKGYVELTQLLLEKGAAPSVPGGPDNFTPLHDAVAHGSRDIIRLLIVKGANKAAMDSKGRTPRSFAFSADIAELIDSTLSEVTESQCLANIAVAVQSSEKNATVLYFENPKDVTSRHRSVLVKTLDWKIHSQFGDEVTHVVFSSCEKTATGDLHLPNDSYLYFEAVLAAKKAVSMDWISKCVETSSKVDSSQFLISGTSEHHSFPLTKSLKNASKRLPRLFDGMHFNIHPSVEDRKGLSEVIRRGSGIILKREPDPEFIPEHERRIPYHADPDGPLKSCSHFIIYQSGARREPELKYDMSHVKTLSTQWIIACIHNFAILAP